MLSSVEQAFVGRDEKRAPLKMPAWEATAKRVEWRCYAVDHPSSNLSCNKSGCRKLPAEY